MAVFAMTDCYIGFGTSTATDRSTLVKSVTLTVDAATLDTTDFGDSGWTTNISGMKSGSLAMTFNQDVASGAIDSIMWPLLGTVCVFEVRATNSAVGASNPKYTGSFVVNGWTPLDGSVGDLAAVSVTFPLTGAVTRATS